MNEITDYLKPKLTKNQLSEISNLGLAHIGDCVYEIMVRSYLILQGKSTASGLHRHTVRYVSAPAQAQAMQRIIDMLSEAEAAVFRRGRNARVNSVPKNADRAQYHTATGLETLFGYLYLNGETERLGELFNKIMENDTNAT